MSTWQTYLFQFGDLEPIGGTEMVDYVMVNGVLYYTSNRWEMNQSG